jgi:HAD superfamily hydrolase (TIGR01450 family)
MATRRKRRKTLAQHTTRHAASNQELTNLLNLKSIHVFFFDLDGVLSIGKEKPQYLAGREAVAKIKAQGKKAFLLTNDSTHTRQEILGNLTRLGFSFQHDEILSSSYLTAKYLTNQFGTASFFLVGENGLRRELEAAGHNPTEEKPNVVVVGFDRQLTYNKLDHALSVLREGAKLIGSYGGSVFMSDHGPALSAGPIIKALEYGSGKRAVMIGKPSPKMFRLALRIAEEKPQRAVMVGDQIETDVLGAHRARVRTILVLTGVENKASIRASTLKPDMVLENVDKLVDYL